MSLREFIKGPDYPTNAEIISTPEEINTVYDNGKGSIKMRAVWEKESSDVIISSTTLSDIRWQSIRDKSQLKCVLKNCRW